jgi:hypothetical protein
MDDRKEIDVDETPAPVHHAGDNDMRSQTQRAKTAVKHESTEQLEQETDEEKTRHVRDHQDKPD